MKKLILVLITLIGLIGSVSAETVKIKGGRYLVSNENIGTIEYLVQEYKDYKFSAFYNLLEACGKHCTKCIKNNEELDPEVKALTRRFGMTISSSMSERPHINVYDGENYSTYIFYKEDK